MNDQTLIYDFWIFFGSMILVLSLVLIIYIYNYLFIKKNSKELSERIYGIEEYLDEVGVSFEKVMQLNFIFSLMWFSYFVQHRYFKKKMSYFAKRGEKSPSLYPNLYQDNVIYLCEKFGKQIITNEVLAFVSLFFGISMFTSKYIAKFIVYLGF
ncbi:MULTISPECIES: hypothetical protein [Acinetobacter]|uniref:hypothetical protein n=1 Tax=Acinetobacter TaxID=469 RepID=UPI0005F7B73F|nr:MULTISPECIES: hypothetical protein [Acinetobacter]KJV38483.1 hypothetical protein VH96_14200 [Acinetobacter indicus]MDM1281941.1 hypothetical protein [Acinetobacter indicus]MDM1330886.1 hypothetical protein [Acinetobacter indicus]MDM1339353.1 hypothetical protein [Acinetobacter indicus]OUY05521.1 hypothetical protein CAP42_14540 [Acinetobacter indicus]